MSQINMNYENKPYFVLKDPISSLSHFIGFILAILFTPVLLSKAAYDNNEPVYMISASIFCLSMILLYGASSAYHSFILKEKGVRRLKKIDHLSIFILIAGTYTPLCLITLNNNGGLYLLAAIWSCALIGMIIKFFFICCPKYVSSLIYIFMGWLAIFRIKTLFYLLGKAGFGLLLAGGILYTIGGIIYALKISFSDSWSEHELFHIFVLCGTVCHFLMIFYCVI